MWKSNGSKSVKYFVKAAIRNLPGRRKQACAYMRFVFGLSSGQKCKI